MPYNTTAIPPRREPTGQAQLPLSRVKKIIALDNDISQCSNNGAFVITLATEMFIQYLAEQGHNVVKSERKPRRNIQYRDLSNAIARLDNLEFLVDVVPRTVPYKQVKEKKPPTAAGTNPHNSNNTNTSTTTTVTNGEPASGPVQTTLDGAKLQLPNGSATNGVASAEEHEGGVFGGDAGAIVVGGGEDVDDGPNAQLEMEFRGAVGEGKGGEQEDVEMS